MHKHSMAKNENENKIKAVKIKGISEKRERKKF